MKERVNEKWQLPEALRVTEEMMPAIEKAQAELAARVASPFSSLTPQEQERARALDLIKDHTVTLAALDTIIGRALSRDDIPERELREYAAAKDARPHVAKQLAEAYASSGRFDLAAQCEPDRKEKANYVRIWRAVWRDDEHFCSCPPNRGSGRHADVEAPRHFAVKDIYSAKHDKVLPLLKCGKCPCMNVTTRKDLLEPIMRQRSHRAQAHALAAGLRPADAAAKLREAGHTTGALTR